jgi:WD40 repeat protein
MKQLLDACENYLIVALNHRAFVVPFAVNSGIAPTSTAALIELILDTDDTINNALEIQAVAIFRTRNTNELWCAVSRVDKSLCVYQIPTSSGASLVTLKPHVEHKTTKRAGSLCFATVGDDLTVIVAGDLAGDATAYSLQTSSINVGTEDNSVSSRLLLGHTASMLTSVRLVGNTTTDDNSGQQQVILTCDRDEKIRVSSFPDCFKIKGFLLGHEAFISDIDVATSAGSSICVSASGDGTVRLWDINSCKELSMKDVSKDDSETPARVSISTNGSKVAVIFDESKRLELLTVDDNKFGNSSSIETPSKLLSVIMYDNDTILTLQKAPTYVQAYAVTTDDKNNYSIASSATVNTVLDALTQLALDNAIYMPYSVLEKDKHGTLKMNKISESRGPAKQMPWNDSSKKETVKAREKRQKRNKYDRNDAEGYTKKQKST